MRVVIQRVTKANVEVDKKTTGAINKGLLILAGFESSDTKEDLEWIAAKIVKLRIFDDRDGVMNLSISEINGDILLVSQFTLHAKTKKGNRPSYVKAAPPEISIPLYETFKSILEQELGKPVFSGIFGAKMSVSLVNDGPVTIIIDSKNKE